MEEITNLITPFTREEDEVHVRHNWLYSVVPGGANYAIYLVAYCKNDRKYVTVRLHTDNMENQVIEGNAAIPVWGCKPIEGT